MYFDIETILTKNTLENSEHKKETVTEMISILDEEQLIEAISFLKKPFFTKKLEEYLLNNQLPPIGSEEFRFLVEAVKYNGNIVQKIMRKSGISDYYMRKLTKKYHLLNVGKGLFVFPHKEIDAPFLFQQQYSKSVISHESALYLLDLTTVIPKKTIMSMPKEYNFSQIIQSRSSNVKIVESYNNYTGNEIHVEYDQNVPIAVRRNESIVNGELETRITKNGNHVRVTSAERTIADVLKRNAFVEEEVKEMAIVEYFKDSSANKTRLRRVAKGQKVLETLDEYLWKLKLF